MNIYEIFIIQQKQKLILASSLIHTMTEVIICAPSCNFTVTEEEIYSPSEAGLGKCYCRNFLYNTIDQN